MNMENPSRYLRAENFEQITGTDPLSTSFSPCFPSVLIDLSKTLLILHLRGFESVLCIYSPLVTFHQDEYGKLVDQLTARFQCFIYICKLPTKSIWFNRAIIFLFPFLFFNHYYYNSYL